MKKRKKSSDEPVSHDHHHDEAGEGLSGLFRDDFMKLSASRRDFLRVLGFSFASAAVMAACRRPVRQAVPYPVQPPELVPRKPMYYASTFFDGHEYCSIVVKNVDGRPIKIEGNNLSAFNGEGTTARVQASILSIYDDARLKFPSAGGKRMKWEELDKMLLSDLRALQNQDEVVLLSPTLISPSTEKAIGIFGKQFGNFRWVQYDPVSYSAITEANEASFGSLVFPDYHFQNADLIVSVNCDFLGTWGAPVHFTPNYISRRIPENKNLLRHIQVESGMTLTGSNADKRIRIKPSEEKALLMSLYNSIAGRMGAGTLEAPVREDVREIADALVASQGKSIVVSGTNSREIQLVVNGINSLLGNYGSCIDLVNHLNIGHGRDSAMEELVGRMADGGVKALFMYNVNPLYDYHDPQKFESALSKIPVTVNMSVAISETTGKAKYECPVNHFLESWDDAMIVPGELSLQQPVINPIFDTRQFQESLLRWSGVTIGWRQFLMSSWEQDYFPSSGMKDFTSFWNKSLSEGVFGMKTGNLAAPVFRKEVLGTVRKPESAQKGFEVVLAESVSLGTGMHANNPWLMELPDAVTRLAWENVACLSPADAANAGILNGMYVKIGDGLVLPALIQPGQADGTVMVFLGFGHTGSGPVAQNGVNVYPYAKFLEGNRTYSFTVNEITLAGGERQLARVQMYDSQEGRPLARETTYSRYLEDPKSGNEHHFEFETMHKSLYPDEPYDGFHWAIALDLSKCTGCQACVIACQAENNTPTVGHDEVRRNRIMHWIKLHRYYSGDWDNPDVIYQPVFCQHCDDAPCENVCPVSATNHSNEGLNQMAYNRCVGTKYCMNNCPYKVRRFNWFRYTGNKEFDYNAASDLGKMVLNPDVTVRERGVVEKCTFCVQRIQAGKLQAKLEGRRLKDLEVKPACMQSCPAGAIIFGDLNDENSLVSRLFRSERRYGLLEELHTLPKIGFMTKVRNSDDLKKQST